MSELVRDETPMEFFREQLERAMEHQKVSTSAFTEHYLVNLLSAAVRDRTPPEPGLDDTPLAILYIRAVQASRAERARLLRAMGDTALFVSGFFADSLSNTLADLGYYKAMGGHAYARLSREDAVPGGLGAAVFSELSGRFSEFADVLAEVSEASRLATNSSVLRLYERWVQTGSRRAAAMLAERGIAPVLPGDGRPQ
jgi:hypothetical protein